jgi:hypothetical protein
VRGSQKEPESKRPRRPPATTSEGRENQLNALAYDLAEKQLTDGTASAQVISHFLKMGSTREALEQQRIRHENELLRVKAESIAKAEDMEKLYRGALDAMRSYKSSDTSEDDHVFED